MHVSPFEKEIYNDRLQEQQHYGKDELLRHVRLRDLFLRLRERRVQLPGKQLRVWLPQARHGPVVAKSLALPNPEGEALFAPRLIYFLS